MWVLFLYEIYLQIDRTTISLLRHSVWTAQTDRKSWRLYSRFRIKWLGARSNTLSVPLVMYIYLTIASTLGLTYVCNCHSAFFSVKGLEFWPIKKGLLPPVFEKNSGWDNVRILSFVQNVWDPNPFQPFDRLYMKEPSVHLIPKRL